MPRLAISLLVLSVLPGCVERALVIRSDPPGAKVFVDGSEVGTTPAQISFDHYGTREVMVRLEGTERGDDAFAPETRLVKISAPWYQWFPLDLASEFLWPGTIRDEHIVDFALEPHDAETLRARFAERAGERGVRMPLETPAKEPPPDEAGESPPEQPE